ncbi:glutamine synthetase III family protein [Maribacter cobaltidurans]|uniref:Glutamine synthetase type III n=1 Tax=Maribacter cobaltidurans TaxID=1178778 RepID=A0A223V1E5_9FLAO|nr:glutamine synthetase III [Maribacter cobaltidurans]ASV29164.1 glutamine synthetase type III [Maribacter cobaltidurans]GGD71370.1 glutamine synthetase [Maribacter cobaltidurans]
MSIPRFEAIVQSLNRAVISVEEKGRRSDIFGVNVFNEAKMLQYLTKDAYESLKDAIVTGSKIDRKIADQVAEAIKGWAITMGATHYTHWFQPLTGSTAEKHDAFFDLTLDGRALEKFGGGQLVQQEPDASSFPSGGIRNTFEARGYTAWDPTSPAFVYGTTLCIPTIFVSYTGEALDNKAPLLRALGAVDEAATQVAKYFDKNVTKVNATLGWEQEYFLIDKALAYSRPDIVITGRTLLGVAAPKGQQLDDHYFGVIPSRVLSFMSDLEKECTKLGIPVKTRHNEVAPNQFELAPVFEEANLAVDHNLLLMDVMDKIADRHNLKVLFHEKPFAGVNGSGKHNNWSLATDTGVNLLSPGSTPMKNLQFLTFFVNTIKAVDTYEEVLRSSIASASNDHRLGANEAPPAIFSIFIGKQLSSVLDELEGVSQGKLSPEEKTELKLNVVGKIPEILLDNTDRNRTSPFAFTGNKFEMRGVGSKTNCAKPMTVLNTIVAKQLKDFKKEVDLLLDKKGLKKDEAIFNVLREYIKTCKRIRFDGDGYSKDWETEAKKRKLSNNKNTPEALKILSSKDTIDLFKSMKVLSEVELGARMEVELETYVMHLQIEGQMYKNLVYNSVIPSAIAYQNKLITNVTGLKEIYGAAHKGFTEAQLSMVEEIGEHISALKKATDTMSNAQNKADKLTGTAKMAEVYCNDIKPYFDTIRSHADQLEKVIEDQLWPLTKYSELLFIK